MPYKKKVGGGNGEHGELYKKWKTHG